MPLDPGKKLGPYEIVALIGRGGMGEVYRAKDPRMRRNVAVKLVTKDFSERFTREVRAIAALNHPNICAIYDVGPNYLVMEYVDGSPVQGPMPEAKAIQLGLQIAEALDAAHARGIIHRDLKPANILVTDSGVKMLDFGLATQTRSETADSPPARVRKLRTSIFSKRKARSYSKKDTVIDNAVKHDGPKELARISDSLVTRRGAIMGTPAYMSPEQSTGADVDVRSDIFSFGALLYELISGRRAFPSESFTPSDSGAKFEQPEPLDASPEVVELVMKCLSRAREARFQTVLEVQLALEKAAAALAKTSPSVAILPFVASGAHADSEYFGDGLAEDIINALSKVGGLSVIARTSSFAFRAEKQDIRGIARTLGVTHVLEGSVRTAKERIRITASLIAAADGSQLWSNRYDRDLVDVFAIQDEISSAIATELKANLSGQPLVKQPTAHFSAYEAVLQGRHHFVRFDPASESKAIECFERAISIDPNYPDAHIGRALYHWGKMVVGLADPRAAMTQSVACARVAVRLDSGSSEANHILGSYFAVHEFDWPEAERYFRQALALNPNSVGACHCYAQYYLCPLGRMEEALEIEDFALTKDPLALYLHFIRALILDSLGRDEAASESIERINKLDPSFVFGQLHLVQLMGRQKRFVEATELAEQMIRRAGRWGATLGALGIAHAMAGRPELAHDVITELAATANHHESGAFFAALISASMGDNQSAFEWATKSIEHRDHLMALYLRTSTFDLLRADGSYNELLRVTRVD